MPSETTEALESLASQLAELKHYMFALGMNRLWYRETVGAIENMETKIADTEKNLIKVGLGVLLIHDNRLLIGKRISKNLGNGQYSMPGGNMDAKDFAVNHPLGPYAACAEREVLEETGIVCTAQQGNPAQVELFTNAEILDNGQKYITVYVMAEVNKIPEPLVPLEPHKCESWIWVSRKELADLIEDKNQKIWLPYAQLEIYLKLFGVPWEA